MALQQAEIAPLSPSTPPTDVASSKKGKKRKHARSSSSKKDRRNTRKHPDAAVKILIEWLTEHKACPYPSEREKEELASKTGLKFYQINWWFINGRVRYLPGILKGETNSPPEEKEGADLDFDPHQNKHKYPRLEDMEAKDGSRRVKNMPIRSTRNSKSTKNTGDAEYSMKVKAPLSPLSPLSPLKTRSMTRSEAKNKSSTTEPSEAQPKSLRDSAPLITSRWDVPPVRTQTLPRGTPSTQGEVQNSKTHSQICTYKLPEPKQYPSTFRIPPLPQTPLIGIQRVEESMELKDGEDNEGNEDNADLDSVSSDDSFDTVEMEFGDKPPEGVVISDFQLPDSPPEDAKPLPSLPLEFKKEFLPPLPAEPLEFGSTVGHLGNSGDQLYHGYVPFSLPSQFEFPLRV